MAYDYNAPIPEADWSDPNSPLFNDPNFNHGNWRFNAATGSWEVGNTNMDVSNGITNTVAPGAATPGIDAHQPGASLDATQADADRTSLSGFLSQLTNQANTGSGAWEQALKQNTHATQMNAEALGQTAGLDSMNAVRNVENAQAGAGQRAVGQGRLLRAQTQQQAAGQLSEVLGGQGAIDAQQAAQEAAARQARAQANATLDANARKGLADSAKGGADALIMMASSGGRVPGTPKVMADSPVNDTVRAKSTEGSDLRLSPGEIIIPLSIAESPNAPELAADFVAALKARRPEVQTAFDAGGKVPTFTDVDNPSDTSTPVSTGIGDDKPRDNFMPTQYAPSIARGSLLDTKAYDATRSASLANSQRFLDAFAGKGPSVAPQAMQNATDSTLADAMRASAGSKQGPVDVTAAATEQSQGAAGNAAGIVAGESQRGGEAFAQALQRQRAKDLALATAKQQAAWRNTMMNAGVSLEQQNQIHNLLGSAGQGAVALGGMFDGPSQSYHYDTGTSRYDTTPAWEEPGIASSPDEWEQPFADGGVVGHLARKAEPKRKRTFSEVGARKQEQGSPDEWKGFPEPPTKHREGSQAEDDVQLNYASGGEVSSLEQLRRLLAGASASPIQFDGTGVPISSRPAGPFDAPLPTQDTALTPEQQAQRMARATTPEQEAQRRQLAAPKPVAPPAAPVAAPPVAPPIAPVAQPPRARPVVSGKLRDAPEAPVDQFTLANQAGEQKAAAEVTQADAQASALMEGQKALEAAAIDTKERAAKASASAQQQLAAIQQAREEMKRIDTSVDPGKMWKDRSMAGKIFSIIGLVAGAIGNDNGVNRAAVLLNQQIDRDIDAQKSAHELALRKGQSAVTSAENLYSISRQAAQDDIAAGLAAKGSALDLVANKVALAAAQAGSPMAKANLTALHAKVMAEKDAADKAAHARLQDMGLKWYAAKTDRIAAERPAGANTLTANFVAPGYALKDGAHPKPDELEKWRTARAGADDVKAKAIQLREMIASGKLSGTSRFVGDERAKAEALIGSLKVAAKEAFALGALSGPDVDLVMSQLADPTGVSGLFSRDKTMTAKLDQFIKNADATVTKKGDSLGIIKEAEQPKSDQFAEARAWLAANPNHPDAEAVRRKIEGR